MGQSIVCVVPAYNEQGTVGEIVAAARKYCDLVIVVDDGSNDRTAQLAESQGAYVVGHPFNMGVGAALATGFRVALEYDADIVVTLDGDGEHDPRDIPRVVKPIQEGRSDLVIGSRLLSDSDGMPLYKRLGNRIVTGITNLVAGGAKITDSQSGFRAYHTKMLEPLIHDAAGYAYASESIVVALRRGFEVEEVPIRARYMKGRWRGTSISDGFRIAWHTLAARKRKA